MLLASLPFSNDAQTILGWSLCLPLLGWRYWPSAGWGRQFFLSLAVFLVVRYFAWRFEYTIGLHDPFSTMGAVLLLAAELYGAGLFLLSVFVNLQPVERQRTPILPGCSSLPSVDVLVPSFNEAPDLLRITLVAATDIDYPHDHYKVYLLDDGATEARLNAQDPLIASTALERKIALKAICDEIGVTYLSRSDNASAKSGNLNAALSHIHGDLVLLLDADHVPQQRILKETVQYFMEDPALFLLQTPHHFITPDPIEKNLDLFEKMPHENIMFFGAIHPGMDLWDSSYFCGSAALMRRSAIDDVGGFMGQTITEDAETALGLHRRGWKSIYLNEPLISGLQPDTFLDMVVQRMRWAQGMLQLFVLTNPLTGPGLSLPQRLCYLTAMLYWLFPVARIIYLLAPAFFILFGLRIYDASMMEIMVFAVPYLIALHVTSQFLFSRYRWGLVSSLYENMLSFFVFGAIVSVFKNPRSPNFKVTPKNVLLSEDAVSPLVKPFFWATALQFIVLSVGIWRFMAGNTDRSLLLVASFWLLLNITLMIANLGALLERAQRRRHPRVETAWDGTVVLEGRTIKVRALDMSMGGACCMTQLAEGSDTAIELLKFLRSGTMHGVLEVECNRLSSISFEVTNCRLDGDEIVFSIQFNRLSINEYRHLVRLVYGANPSVTRKFETIYPEPPILRILQSLVSIGVSNLWKEASLYFGRWVPSSMPQLGRLKRIFISLCP